MKIIIADDNDLDLYFLERHLNQLSNITIVGKFKDGKKLLEYALNNAFDIIITDLYMPILNAIEVIEKVSKSKPESKFIVCSNNKSRHIVELLNKINNVNYIPKYSVDFFDKIEICVKTGINKIEFQLTDREKKIFYLLISSKSTNEICEEYCISVKNLERYKTSIFQKCNVKSRLELIDKFK